VLLEFCLPFAELKHIVDGLDSEDNTMLIDYPVEDCYLEIKIPEESKAMGDKVKNDTRIVLQTYEAQHSLDADFSFKNTGVAA
jgi:frataxin-like iron-binding protein CyaY